MRAFDGLNVYYGDLHNHCDISYGHGSLKQALDNARQQLDFCSVTGHALWPDMPEPDDDIQTIVDYHLEGFTHLRACWPEVLQTIEDYNQPGVFVTFPSFEMHSCADGDYTILYRDTGGRILSADGLADLRHRLRTLKNQGVDVIAFPHHIAYRRGQRGINWTTFEEEFSPIVELVSMHGCSEADENTRPFLHVMGPSDHESTMQYGLENGAFFGVIGSTDHHSAYPGSYGHGRTGLWAHANTRESIWEALCSRRTYALTGDRIALQFAINDYPMGSRVDVKETRQLAFHVDGGAPLDYVDIVKNGDLLRRFSRCDMRKAGELHMIRTKLYLEVGWGERGRQVDWDVEFGISDGRILAIEPRFRGPEIVDPTERAPDRLPSEWEFSDSLSVRFRAVTFGNPNNRTPATQGMCLHVEMPAKAVVQCLVNERKVEYPLTSLMDGARSGRLGKIGSACYRLHRAPHQWEYDWHGSFDDLPGKSRQTDVYYARVRQANGEWAWSSPIQVNLS
ncbi:MAG: DUF3604 domain-containing protein [Anaerolineae bacterium]|nr:DUF3604 domain-containing protein [Anaerolineae bacterium]